MSNAATNTSARKVHHLSDFQRQAGKVNQLTVDLYVELMALKGMWDSMEQIPTKQQPLYDEVMKIAADVRKAGDKAYNLKMKLKRYK